MPRDLVLPGRRTNFEGAACWEPEKPLGVLDRLYPGWRVRETTPTWNHREDRFTDAIASRRIRTDASGRKIDQDPAVMRVPKLARGGRPCLVVVRADGRSRCKAWMRPDAARAWDLLVNHRDDPDDADDVADIVAIGGTAKYPAAKDLYHTDASLLRERKAVLFLDDDIDIAFEDLDRLFEIFLVCDLWLAQPSWAPGSPGGTTFARSDPRFELRYTDRVDGAATLFSQSALAACIESFDRQATADAPGTLWPKLLEAPFDRVGVIDAVAVRQVGDAGRRTEAVDRGARLLGYVKRSGEVLQKFRPTS